MMSTTWLDVLQREVSAKGPRQVAKELGLSRTTIDLVSQGKYMAGTEKVEARVRQIYYGTNGMVGCPVLGDITPMMCSGKFDLAKKIGMRAGNPETLRLYKTCVKCPVRRV